MADGSCEWGDTPHQRNHILTTLNPPASTELCDEHYPAGLILLLAVELGLDGDAFYAYVEKYVKRESAKAEKALADAQAAAAAQGSQGPTPPGGDAGGDSGIEPPHVDNMNAGVPDLGGVTT